MSGTDPITEAYRVVNSLSALSAEDQIKTLSFASLIVATRSGRFEVGRSARAYLDEFQESQIRWLRAMQETTEPSSER